MESRNRLKLKAVYSLFVGSLFSALLIWRGSIKLSSHLDGSGALLLSTGVLLEILVVGSSWHFLHSNKSAPSLAASNTRVPHSSVDEGILEGNPFIRFHHLLLNNRWIKQNEDLTFTPTVRDIVIGAFWGTLVITILTLFGLDEVVYGNFSTQTLPYLSAIILLLLAGYILYLMVFSVKLRIRKLLEVKRLETRTETSNG